MQSVIGNFTGNSLTDNRISSLIPILSTGIGLSLKILLTVIEFLLMYC